MLLVCRHDFDTLDAIIDGMNSFPILSEITLRQHSAGESFSQGQAYYKRGAVTALTRRGGLLQAEVEGSQYAPYNVRVTFDVGGVTSASCTCAYNWGGWCKHILATLLACIQVPETIDVRPELDASIAELDRGQLQALLLRLAGGSPEMADKIEAELTLLKSPAVVDRGTAPTASPGPARRTPVDVQPIRRQIRTILHPSRYDDYGAASGVVSQVRQVLEQAQRFSTGGDGRDALLLLEAITDEYAEAWHEIDDSDGELGAFFEELATAWAEAFLSVDLAPPERREWSEKLAGWQHDAEDYGVGDEFEIAQLAATQGWDDPALRRVLQGEITEKGTWDDAAPDSADELARIRLAVLERQGRLQEYVYLAEAEGLIKESVIMLARTGRVQEAVAEGLKYLSRANDALTLATVLRERGELEQAVRIAEHGLELADPKGPLSSWLTDVAVSLGRHDLALRAAELAFRSTPSLSAYLNVQELAGEGWPALRTALLEHLRASVSNWSYDAGNVDVFLHEGLIDDAIKVVQSGASYGLLERVMDAAITHRPDWVIQAATSQAERIMNAGKAERYDRAVNWLKHARDAYRAGGRETDWREYLRAVRQKHGRKYKLMGLMDQL